MSVRSAWLAGRSLLWVILLPGVIAGYIPWRYFNFRLSAATLDALSVVGLACMLAGIALLAVCVWEFARSGRGTLSPVDPPRQLVVRGLYRYMRNPMYVAVTAIVLGEAMIARSLDLVIYWAAFFLAANLFVIGYEEPNLRRRFGASYEEYTRSVRRWIPRFSARP
jgi:protein-S-isoprenylcysteine O-methyltransferase Ste14